MGLYVSVYIDVKIAKKKDEYAFTAYVIDGKWRHKVKNLEYNKNYTGELAEISLKYSYSTHNRFREILIKIIGMLHLLNADNRINWVKADKLKSFPFSEFIIFADNEGCIDFETNSIIYKDFVKWKSKAMEYLKEDDYFRQAYLNWLDIFKESKNINSVVVFS